MLFPFFAVWWITAYFGIAVFAMFLKEQWHFWFLAILVGMFQGGIQALSRSYFTKIIPAEKTGEYYGHMRERRFLPWYDRDQPCFTINRTSIYRCGSDFVVFYIGYDRI